MHNQPPTKFDIEEAARTSLRIAGVDTLLNYPRLRQETQAPAVDQPLHWCAQFDWRPDQTGQPCAWLRLEVSTALAQICQRCLGPVDVPVSVDRVFRFVDSEAVAEAQDDASDEDLLVTSREFDLAALIEDEVLLDLPLVPRHDTCPVPLKLSAVDADFEAAADKPHPFAVLAQLKGAEPD